MLWMNNGYTEDEVNNIVKITENSNIDGLEINHYNYKGFYILKDLIITMNKAKPQFTYFVFHDMARRAILLIFTIKIILS